ncbi:MAG: hypothetical protein CFE26_05995 [Verrucomicrobiales bacterium VVV1]|nr:MAG: hypothetical protein CFE26_05995 [Verrucomicrobiales bacterium VVV1]
MKRIFIPLFLALLSVTNLMVAEESKDPRITGLDTFWTEVSRSVHEGDFEAYSATCHPEGVLVSGSKKTSSPLSVALARWKKEFTATKSGEMKASVEFRFSQRLGDETTAHETGIFLYSSTGPDGKPKQEYIHFEVLLVKKDGHWMTLMEYQKSQASLKEWEALSQGS